MFLAKIGGQVILAGRVLVENIVTVTCHILKFQILKFTFSNSNSQNFRFSNFKFSNFTFSNFTFSNFTISNFRFSKRLYRAFPDKILNPESGFGI